MKLLNYEKTNFLILSIIIFSIIIIFFTIYIFVNKMNNYYLIRGVIRGDNLVEVLVDDKELTILYSNKVLYVNNINSKFKLEKIDKDIMVKEDNKYHLVFIKVKVKGMENDIVDLSLKNKRIYLWEIFKTILEGDE